MKKSILMFALGAAFALAIPGSAAAQENPGPDTVHFTPERGAVTFIHGKHSKMVECSTCHHESKAEKPLESPRQKCGSCHTAEPVAPMKTSLRRAFHDTANKSGMCLSCHIKEAEAGKTVPTTCSTCHIKPEQ